MKTRVFLHAVFLLIITTSLYAHEPLKPLRATTPPIIDGKLDDPLWQQAPSVGGFKTFIPDFGKDASERTVVYFAYDEENLYFAYKCYDSEPDKIKTSVTSRDNIRPDDWVCINLDSFNDQQSLYALYVNPMGIQSDSRYAAGVEDAGFDMVWYSGGQVDDEGYSVEYQIPLKSIRYSNTNPVEMSIFFERHISRRSEQVSFPALDPDKGYAFLTQMQPLHYYDVKHHTLFEVLPAVTYSNRQNSREGKLHTDENTGDFSLTTKYGVTSDLILDGTYNPDFSQIEADAGQVDINLRYALYYPEKRPFFLEGRENFTLASTFASELDPIRYIVHTRTIHDPLVGVKLAGKVGAKNTLSSIYALDELPDPINGNDYAHFGILRYKRSLKDDSFLGGIFADREYPNHFNRVAGADGQVRLTESSTVAFHGLMSQTKENEAAKIEYDRAIGMLYSYGTRDVDIITSVKDVSEQFRAEMGYITRTGITQFTGLIRPKLYPKAPAIQRIDAEVFSAQTRDSYSDLWETFNHLSFQFYVLGNSSVKLKYSYSTEIFLGERFDTGGFHALFTSQVTKQFYFGVLYRNIDAIYYDADPFQGHSNRLTAEVVYQPSDRLISELSYIYYDFYREADDKKIYDYPITRAKLTYQVNKYLFFRGIVEYNDYREDLLTDFLASFTYIPGTVVHIGYGSFYEKLKWEQGHYRPSNAFLETKRGFFFKTSYLWRL